MLTYLIRNFTGSADELCSFIRHNVEQSDPSSFIIIVPTNRRIRELQRSLVSVLPAQVSAGLQLFTLERFARALHRHACPPRTDLSPSIQAILFDDAVRELLAEGELAYFSLSRRGGRIPPGTLERVIRVITMLKESGIYQRDLIEELQELERKGLIEGGERSKLADVAAIYERYEQKLDDRFIDLGGVYQQLNVALASNDAERWIRTAFPQANVLIVNGFDEFSQPERAMLNAVSGVRSLTTLISFDYCEGNQEVFGHLEESYQALLEMGFSTIEHADPLVEMLTLKPPGDKDVGVHLARNLFQPSPQSRDYRDRMTVLACRDRREEVRAIVRTIKRWLIDHPNHDTSTICVATYQSDAYTPLVRELFAEYGVPVNITDRYVLAQSPLVIGIMALADVAKNNFRRKDVIRALSSPYFGFSAVGGFGDGDEAIDVANLITVASELKLSFSADRWVEVIDRRIHATEDALRSPHDELDEASIERSLAQYRKAKTDVRGLQELLRPFAEPLAPPVFRRELFGLLERLHTLDRLFALHAGSSNAEALERDLRALERFREVVDEVVQILQIQGAESTTFSIDVYVERLRTAIQHARYNIRQRAGYGVLVTTIEETRGIDFDLMFVAGLVDGEFPLPYQPEIFLSKPRQLRQERYHLIENRYLFYQAVRNHSRHVFLTYPQRDGELELVRSTFIDALVQTVQAEHRTVDEHEGTTRWILSRNEALQRYGQEPTHDVQARVLADDFSFIDHVRRVEQSRWLTHALPEYEGDILASIAEEAKRSLGQWKERVYSVSQLEAYALCPFQFFAQRVLRLGIVPEVEEGLSPLEKGYILHGALFEFFVERRTNKLPRLRDCSDREFRDAVERLTAIVRRRLEEVEIHDVFWEFDREQLLGSPTTPGILHSFLEFERRRDVAAVPRYFEVSFGRGTGATVESDPLLPWPDPISLGGVCLRGKVDRIDIAGDRFAIIDYKTGRAPTPKERELGISVQLAVYLAAMEAILTAHAGKPMKAGAGVFLQLRESVTEKDWLVSESAPALLVPEKKRGKRPTDEEFRREIDQAIGSLQHSIEGIVAGRFPLTTEEKVKYACTWCDFSTACRIRNREWIERPQSAETR